MNEDAKLNRRFTNAPAHRRMTPYNSARLQRGLLLEVPLLFAAIVMVLAVVAPALPPLAGNILVALGALVIIALLAYLVLMPGWQPGRPAMGRVKATMVFLFLVLVTFVCAASFIVQNKAV